MTDDVIEKMIAEIIRGSFFPESEIHSQFQRDLKQSAYFECNDIYEAAKNEFKDAYNIGLNQGIWFSVSKWTNTKFSVNVPVFDFEDIGTIYGNKHPLAKGIIIAACTTTYSYSYKLGLNMGLHEAEDKKVIFCKKNAEI